MTRTLYYIALFFCLLATACNEHKTDSPTPKVDTLPLMLTRLQDCSRIYATEIKVHKIITHKDVKKVEGKVLGQDFSIDVPMTKRRIAIPVDATIKAYVDMEKITASNIVRNGDNIKIILPRPQIILTATKIDHNTIKSYVSLMGRRFTDEELSIYEQQGRDAILKEIDQYQLMETARRNAANTLIPVITRLGFEEKNITISFEKTFSLGELQRFITFKSHGDEQ